MTTMNVYNNTKNNHGNIARNTVKLAPPSSLVCSTTSIFGSFFGSTTMKGTDKAVKEPFDLSSAMATDLASELKVTDSNNIVQDGSNGERDTIGDFLIGPNKGGRVYNSWNIKTKRVNVIKLIKKSDITGPSALAKINREASVMNHHGYHQNNIIAIREILHSPTYIAFVMEDGIMTLDQLMCNDEFRHQHDLAQQVTAGLVNATRYLHSVGIAHGDIQTCNVVFRISKDTKRILAEHVRLCNFGRACFAVERDPNSTKPMDLKDAKVYVSHADLKTSTSFRAPETCDDSHSFDLCGTDMWSIGLCLMRMVYEEEFSRVQAAIRCNNFAKVQRIVDGLKDGILGQLWERKMNHFMFATLEQDPKKRMVAKEAMEHTWMFHDY